MRIWHLFSMFDWYLNFVINIIFYTAKLPSSQTLLYELKKTESKEGETKRLFKLPDYQRNMK